MRFILRKPNDTDERDDLRHTFATLSLQNGTDIKTVSESMGHATTAFTMDRYGHVSQTMMKNSADRMQNLIDNL